MAEIRLESVRHSYLEQPVAEADFALRRVDLAWRDGGAYALLGPSGCGKTTLLNIVSGLIHPTEGRVLFDGADVTGATPVARNIAQVFQFPVVYDTMTVYDNLAFPLRNRRLPAAEVDARVREIARMLELESTLGQRASGLTADGKQKISLGRGLVRSDVNVIMFDEPLTVIDPHLKWVLRSKLKELHQRTGRTMIYVTHDQTEALTFAEEVVVMHEGQVVQTGTPVELFERPRHTFVGYFIGSPGMNLLACELDGDRVRVGGERIAYDGRLRDDVRPGPDARVEIGVRPEFVRFAAAGEDGLPVRVLRGIDAGRFRIVDVETRAEASTKLKLLVPEGARVPADDARIVLDASRTHLYIDGWLATEAGA